MSINIETLLTNKSWSKSRLESYYKQIIIQDYLLKQNIKNLLEIPKITKITLHFTSSAIVNEKKFMVNALVALQLLSGQQAVVILAKKSVAAFKIRKKQLIGCKITLRGNGLYFFLDNFINVVIPRLGDSDIHKMFTVDLLSGTTLPLSLTVQAKSEQDGKKSKHENFLSLSGRQHCMGVKQLLLFPQLENQFQFFECLNGLDIIISTESYIPKSSRNKKLLSIILSGFQLPISQVNL